MSIETDNPTAEFEFTFDDEVVTVTLEFHLSDNAEEFFNVAALVGGISSIVLEGMSL